MAHTELLNKLEGILEAPSLWGGFELSREELETLITLLRGEWVSVKERLPGEGEIILVHVKYISVPILCIYQSGQFESDFNGTLKQTSNVSHWLSIPVTPKP